MIYVNPNTLIYLLHDVKPKSDLVIDALFSSDEVYTNLRTIEEASYVHVRIHLSKRYGIKGIYQIQETIRKVRLRACQRRARFVVSSTDV